MTIFNEEENKINTEKFCGINIFTWKEWDSLDVDVFCFYKVNFFMDSMQKYNNCSVVRELNGTMKIYDKENNIIWTGYVTDIKEVMTELNKK